MIRYPKMKTGAGSRQRLEVFKGLDHRERIGTGMFSNMENLTSDHYPVLSPRGKRGFVGYIEVPGYTTGMLYVPGIGVFLTVNVQTPQGSDDPEEGELYLLNTEGEVKLIASRLAPGTKSLALMGKKLIVAPDMIDVDPVTLSYGKIERIFQIKNGMVNYQMCREDGTFYSPLTSSEASPDNPADGDYWLELHGKDTQLRQYSATTKSWTVISPTYTKIWGEGINNHGFHDSEAVTISGLSDLEGQHLISCVDQDSMVIELSFVGSGAVNCHETQNITMTREVPDLDFIVESGNRLWGCSQNTNELYACKLGDYKSWYCFQKLSTDSWVGNVGTPGEFTGAVVQNGYPIFYKETCKHKIWPSATGAHQITTVICDGVEKGSEKSLAVLDGTVFYKSPFGIVADDGGHVEIGQALGDMQYRNAYGAVHDGKYYLNMENATGKQRLFIYDIAKRVWHCESGVAGVLAPGGLSLYCVSGGELWDLTGKTGTPEETVSWMAVTGDLGLELPEQKYISRLTLRLSLEPGATFEIYAQYDREETWVKLGQVYGTDLRSFSLPVRPRRCDQLRLKLQGSGMCKLYSLTKTLEKGSELT